MLTSALNNALSTDFWSKFCSRSHTGLEAAQEKNRKPQSSVELSKLNCVFQLLSGSCESCYSESLNVVTVMGHDVKSHAKTIVCNPAL